MTKIHLVLSDDWELRGDGSGNVRALQFKTMRQLRQIYEDHGLRGSFNAEVMQQLNHLKWGEQNLELKALAQEWEQIVRETYSRGHDVQLHVHPQWSKSVYEDGRWNLEGDWSILRYSGSEIRAILKECKGYLENLLCPLNPEYQCLTFRSGSWCIAPHDELLSILAELGIVFDMSICEGLYYTKPVQIDYREIEEGHLPYYPNMRDARRVANVTQPLVEVPTHSFTSTTYYNLLTIGYLLLNRVAALRYLVGQGYAEISDNFMRTPDDTRIIDGGTADGYSKEVWASDRPKTFLNRLPVVRVLIARQRFTSDISMLTFAQMEEMFRDIRRRAKRSDSEIVPVMLENHTKDIGNFKPIERFAAYVAKAPDIEVITSTELANNLRAGLYKVKTR